MRVFINDIPVIFQKEQPQGTVFFDNTIEGLDDFKSKNLKGDVLLLNVSEDILDKLFKLLYKDKIKGLNGITVIVRKNDTIKRYLKEHFRIVKAAGGIVEKEGKLLFIKRFGLWDLPKGKKEKGEMMDACALREVEEECSVEVRNAVKVCSTWHTYTRFKRRHIKKTVWYAMDLVNDSDLKPQLEESIEDARFLDSEEVREAMYNTYPSIRHVINQYYSRQVGR